MMKKRIITTLLLMTIGFSARIMSTDSCNDQGRTLLMNFIIEQEQLIVEKELAIDLAFAACFGKGYCRKDYRYSFIDNRCVPVDSSTGERLYRLPSCTQETIEALCAAELDLELSVTRAIKNIEIMAQSGMDHNIQDESGKTALDYCVSPILYQTLRAQGLTVSSWKTWLHFNRDYVIVGGFVTFAGGLITRGLLYGNHQEGSTEHASNHDSRFGSDNHSSSKNSSHTSGCSCGQFSRMVDCKKNCGK